MAQYIDTGKKDSNGNNILVDPETGDTQYTTLSADRYNSINNAADAAGKALQSNTGPFDKYFMSNYEKEHDPNFQQDFGSATKDFYIDPKTGKFTDKPPSFLEKWGPWLALAGVGGAMAAPAIAGALGGGGAAATGGGATAATGAGTGAGVGLGETGAVTGLASGAGLPGLVAAPSVGAGTLGAGAGLTGSTFVGPELASDALPGSIASGAAPLTSTGVGTGMAALPTGAATSIGSSGGLGTSLINKLMGGGGESLKDVGSLIGKFAGSLAANRGVKGNQTQGYDQLMLNAQNSRNQTEADALTKLAQTKYLMSGGAKFSLPTLSLNGKMITPPNPGYGPTPSSAAQIQGASTLQDQLLKRLLPGGTYTPTPASTYTDMGTGEKVANGLGLVTSGLGAYKSLFG